MKRQVFVLLFVALGLQSPWAASQPRTPSLAWEKQFPDSIDWYVPTSSGVLLVRTGKTLYAVDGKDGRELWSIKGLDIAGWARGRNLLEIPGTPYLLTKRASATRTDGTGFLLLVDLWTGKSTILESEIHNLVAVIPFYDKERFLLIAGPTDLSVPFKPRFQLQPLFVHQYEKADWRTKYPETAHEFVRFYEFGGSTYVQVATDTGFNVGRFDLQQGKRLWEFGKWGEHLLADPMFVDGKILLARYQVLHALDPGSGKPVWTTEKIRQMSGVVQKGSIILGAGNKGAFALDGSTGAFRWRLESEGDVTNPVVWEENNCLVFCQIEPLTELVLVDIESGAVRLRQPLGLKTRPVSIGRVGSQFLLILTKDEAALCDLATGKVLWADEKPNFAFELAVFLVAHPLPPVGSFELKPRKRGVLKTIGLEIFRATFWRYYALSVDVRALVASPEVVRRLQAAAGALKDRAANDQGWGAVLERLEPVINQGDTKFVTFATEREEGWKLWQINASTGQRQEWILPGEQPDYIAGFGLAYTFRDKTLHAFKLADD